MRNAPGWRGGGGWLPMGMSTVRYPRSRILCCPQLAKSQCLCRWSGVHGVPCCAVFFASFLTLCPLISDAPRSGKWSDTCPPPPPPAIMGHAIILMPVAHAGGGKACCSGTNVLLLLLLLLLLHGVLQ